MNDLLDIRISNFEGPLDLLIHLVYKNEMDIYDISISVITDQFVETVKSMEELDIEVASEFIQMASYLIYLKSKMLLPKSGGFDEDTDLEEEKFNLTQRILEYAFYKDASLFLKEREFFAGRYYSRNIKIFIKSDGEIREDPFLLAETYSRIIEKKVSEPVVTIEKDNFDINHIIDKVSSIVVDSKEIFFDEMTSGCKSSREFVIFLLAVLELIKLKIISVYQEENFGRILIRADG